MGPRLLVNEPKLLDDLAVWDKNFFKLAMGLPKWMVKEAHVARKTMIQAFMKWGSYEEEMLGCLKETTEMSVARGFDQWNLAAVNYTVWTA
jgi:hypothetical protein